MMFKRFSASLVALFLCLSAPAFPAAPTYYGNVGGLAGQGFSSFYVSPSGSDTNNFCTLQSAPCATITQAMNQAMMLSAGGQNGIINLAAGTYTECVFAYGARPFGGGAQHGISAAAGAVIISGAGSGLTTWNGCNNSTANLVLDFPGASVGITGMKLVSTGAAGQSTIYAEFGGQLYIFADINFGATNAADISDIDGYVEIDAAVTISGSGQNFAGINVNGILNWSGGDNLTITGTPSFTAFVSLSNGGIFNLGSPFTVTGSATGPRYLISSGGIANTTGFGCANLPGNAAGTINTGGQCDGTTNIVPCPAQANTFTGTTSDVSGTYTTPICQGVAATSLWVRVVGGGGGGAGSGTAGTGGGAGDASTFSAGTMNAGAGGGGANSADGSPGAGGASSGGTLADASGGAGGWAVLDGTAFVGGSGGTSVLGGGPAGGTSTGGNNGLACGAGGSGAGTTAAVNAAGGGGAGGYAESEITTPSTSYTYLAGKFGSAGAAGTSGGAGGHGGGGCIIVVARWNT